MGNTWILALVFVLPVSAFALTVKEEADAYHGCEKFMKMTSAQQAAAARKTPYTLEQAVWGCKTMLSRSLGEDQRLEQEYEDATKADSAAADTDSNNGPYSCGIGTMGQMQCSHQGDGPNDALSCGVPSPGNLAHCTNPNGTYSSVTCYTNLSGSTSCN